MLAELYGSFILLPPSLPHNQWRISSPVHSLILMIINFYMSQLNLQFVYDVGFAGELSTNPSKSDYPLIWEYNLWQSTIDSDLNYLQWK